MSKKPPSLDIELVPNAWQRFERAAAAVAKSPPQHRVAKKKQMAKKKKAAKVR